MSSSLPCREKEGLKSFWTKSKEKKNPLWGLLIRDLNLILLQKLKSKYTVFVYFPCTTPSIASHNSYHLGYSVIFLDDIWLILTLEDHLQQYTVHH